MKEILSVTNYPDSFIKTCFREIEFPHKKTKSK